MSHCWSGCRYFHDRPQDWCEPRRAVWVNALSAALSHLFHWKIKTEIRIKQVSWTVRILRCAFQPGTLCMLDSYDLYMPVDFLVGWFCCDGMFKPKSGFLDYGHKEKAGRKRSRTYWVSSIKSFLLLLCLLLCDTFSCWTRLKQIAFYTTAVFLILQVELPFVGKDLPWWQSST